MNRRLAFLIVGATTTLTIGVAIAVFWFLGNAEKAARHASTQFAAALENRDPSEAPPGGAGYVSSLHARFGPIRSAGVIDAHNKSINTGDSADTRSYFVADLLLRTARGPAVIELEYDNHSLSNASETVSGVHELRPDKVPAGALGARDRAALAAAYAARAHAPSSPPAAAPAPSQRIRPVITQLDHSAAMKQLKCAQDAKGDITKLKACG